MIDVMNFVKQQNLNVTNQVFENSCLIEFNIRTQEAENTINELEKIEGVKIEFVRTI